MTTFQYTHKRDRQQAIIIDVNKEGIKRDIEYCHVEETWLPSRNFEFFKIDSNRFIPRAVCNKCLSKGLSLDNNFCRSGRIKTSIKNLQRKTEKENIAKVAYKEVSDLIDIKNCIVY